MIKVAFIGLLMIFSLVAYCQGQKKFLLYPDVKATKDDFPGDKEPPSITYFPANPDSSNGAAILVCPGGSYTHLADKHEGTDVARFYNRFGFNAFVLRYRLNDEMQRGHRFPDQYNDVTTAIRLVKSKAKELGFDAERVGIIGFSAGGHLASMGATMHVAANDKSRVMIEHWGSRPAFAILIYPVITLSGKLAHKRSGEMLLGKNPAPAFADSLSTQNRVSSATPPTFLVYSVDDDVVPVENGTMFYDALKRNNIPVSLHIFDHGGHGYGLGTKDKGLNAWPMLSIQWLEDLGYGSRNAK